jgi:hypothetical protein
MMKKLKILICLTAVMLIGTQALVAQSSATLNVTNGRFTTDVDNFFHVNYWAGMEFSKWFSYLKLEDIKITSPDLLPWEAGFALKTSKAHLGFYYSGTFNTGDQLNEHVETIYYDDGSVTKDWPDVTTAGFRTDYNGITHNNLYGILVGVKDMGWQITLADTLKTLDLPQVRASADIAADGFYTGSPAVPAESEGSYRSRENSITPKLTWGMAKDITVGKYSVRPSASIALRVSFDEEEYNLIDPDGEEIHIEDFSGNSLAPTIDFDTGSATLWSGDWGKISLGIYELFGLSIQGAGNNSTVASWNNRLAPYAKFSFDVAPGLNLGAKLNVPIVFGGAPGTTEDYDGYFGIGHYDPAGYSLFPTLGIGVQYVFTSDGIFGETVEKLRINEKLRFNLGINVYLPGYEYSSEYTYDDHVTNPTAIEITETRGHRWFRSYGTDEFLQIVSFGINFAFTPNFVIDAAIKEGDGKILLSVKY